MSTRVLIALGGNAIKQADERGTYEEQMKNVNRTAEEIVRLIREGYRVVVTHGNGPQVGALLIQQEEGAKRGVPPQPMHVCGAMTQGQIGYMLQQALINEMKKQRFSVPVATVITQVMVRKNDPNFNDPHKPVGPFYDEKTARRLIREKGYIIKRVRPNGDKPYRRVVPSPDPIGPVEAEAIKRLVDAGVIVIASGGGGIPVIEDDGVLRGVDAVIDKDLAGEKLAEVVKADIFMILTDVSRVKLNYGKPDERDIVRMTVSEARRYMAEGHFLPGSMEPKVKACIHFIEAEGKLAVIAKLDQALEALRGEAGTWIVPD